jgi:tetratricopeptide (TPR) repeat protein
MRALRVHGGFEYGAVLVLAIATLVVPAMHAQCPLLADAAKPAISKQSPDFFDQPTFTVAGVTDASNLGGHASANSVPAPAVSTQIGALRQSTSTGGMSPAGNEKSLREAVGRAPDSFKANYQLGVFLAGTQRPSEALSYLRHASELKPDNADLRHLLGDMEEKAGDSLAAVKDYQRAAELQPSENNFFDWGAELLTHGAMEPAVQVFSKGNGLFPKSARMLVALGAASYAHGSYDQAGRALCEVVDLDPHSSSPYPFLDKLQIVDGAQSDAIVERLARFHDLEPENPQANYYYARALWNGRSGPGDIRTSIQVQFLLNKAIQIRPNMVQAHVQLGELLAERKDFPKAIAAYEAAIRLDPNLAEPHYRLAEVYRTTGDSAKAQAETAAYKQATNAALQQTERERRDLQQFVYTLRQPGTTRR